MAVQLVRATRADPQEADRWPPLDLRCVFLSRKLVRALLLRCA
jgi:hypothetical protein